MWRRRSLQAEDGAASPSGTPFPFPLAPTTLPSSGSSGMVYDMRTDVLGLGRCVEKKGEERGARADRGGMCLSARARRPGETCRNSLCRSSSGLAIAHEGQRARHPISFRLPRRADVRSFVCV